MGLTQHDSSAPELSGFLLFLHLLKKQEHRGFLWSTVQVPCVDLTLGYVVI